MNRLGLGSYACAWEIQAGLLDAAGLMRRAQRLGVRVVQLADNLRLERADARAVAAIRQLAGEAGIEVEVGMRGIASCTLRKHLELCHDLRARLLRVVSDTPEHQPSPEEIVAALRSIIPLLENHAIALALENHDRFGARTYAGMVDEIGNPGIGICLDTVNSFGAAEGPEQVVETLGARVVNLHLKDFQITREVHGMGFQIAGAPAGQGMLDVPWLLRRLDALGGRGNVILELWPTPEATMQETIEKEQRWCEESIHYLRTLIAD